ncbi:aminopeptidase [Pseudomonas oryzihabitans]|uniref:aminopeptidase n=1 Tax=Pseudomonas oryzihabitans TaxID=47885 RepID=UPI002894B8CC|nr:aminopeptidase [Pseudomonas oryzihabitans]MDT3719537.1 aminopeptidase [Pseudomonas oryzihabitans]
MTATTPGREGRDAQSGTRPARRAGRWLAWLSLAIGLGGCTSVGYYGQMVQGQWALIRDREPIATVVADPARPAALRERLAAAAAARRFASAQLALPDNASYRSFVELHRPFVLWNVFATAEFSTQPTTHCFPIAGCVAYRGYYREAAARAAAQVLQHQGQDTYVGGVPAYSTLGWFSDPLLSSMLRWDDDQVAATIFHELAHQRFYLPGDTAFNESYATFVEQEGLRQWRASRSLPPPDPGREARYQQFRDLLLTTRADLARLYAQPLSPAAKRVAKAERFARLRADYQRLRGTPAWRADRRFDGWMSQPLNNARLVPYGLYEQWVPAFAALYAQHPGNWPAFFHRVQLLGERPAAEREQALKTLLAAGNKAKP